MKKVTVIFLAVIFILGSFEICTAANASNLFKLLRTASNAKFIKNVKTASDGYDILKMGAALIQTDTSELTVHGVELGETTISVINRQWQPERHEVDGKFINWYYQNGTVMIMADEKGVAKVFGCEKNTYIKTKRGIHVGSSLKNVVDAYGTNYDTVALNDYYDAYIFSVKIEENIVDRVSNFLQSKEAKIGKILFVISRQNPEVAGLATALID